jgi:hypothetical protein
MQKRFNMWRSIWVAKLYAKQVPNASKSWCDERDTFVIRNFKSRSADRNHKSHGALKPLPKTGDKKPGNVECRPLYLSSDGLRKLRQVRPEVLLRARRPETPTQ